LSLDIKIALKFAFNKSSNEFSVQQIINNIKLFTMRQTIEFRGVVGNKSDKPIIKLNDRGPDIGKAWACMFRIHVSEILDETDGEVRVKKLELKQPYSIFIKGDLLKVANIISEFQPGKGVSGFGYLTEYNGTLSITVDFSEDGVFTFDQERDKVVDYGMENAIQLMLSKTPIKKAISANSNDRFIKCKADMECVQEVEVDYNGKSLTERDRSDGSMKHFGAITTVEVSNISFTLYDPLNFSEPLKIIRPDHIKPAENIIVYIRPNDMDKMIHKFERVNTKLKISGTWISKSGVRGGLLTLSERKEYNISDIENRNIFLLEKIHN